MYNFLIYEQIIFPWNISAEIIKQNTQVKDWGAKFITVVPEIKIL